MAQFTKLNLGHTSTRRSFFQRISRWESTPQQSNGTVEESCVEVCGTQKLEEFSLSPQRFNKEEQAVRKKSYRMCNCSANLGLDQATDLGIIDSAFSGWLETQASTCRNDSSTSNHSRSSLYSPGRQRLPSSFNDDSNDEDDSEEDCHVSMESIESDIFIFSTQQATANHPLWKLTKHSSSDESPLAAGMRSETTSGFGDPFSWESDPEDSYIMAGYEGCSKPHRRTFSDSESSRSSSFSCATGEGGISAGCYRGDDLRAECERFMKSFVAKIFNSEEEISQTDKAQFGQLCLHGAGRQWFARYISSKRANNRLVNEMVFYRLVQYFAIALFECDHGDDYVPAKTLMIMSFTFYHEYYSNRFAPKEKVFLYQLLKTQPIWQSLRFWNAAFFDVVHCEQMQSGMGAGLGRDQWKLVCSSERTEDVEVQRNIVFGQLGTFTSNMVLLGQPKEMSMEFLVKQSIIGNLTEDQTQLLRMNIDKIAAESRSHLTPMEKFM